MGKVVTVWICKILTEKNGKKYIIKSYKNAVYHGRFGWICDCGRWTKGDDDNHIPLEYGERTIF